jgi:hypothetical protein
MWDEDPRFQEAHWRFVRGSFIALLVLAALLSLITWGWSPLKYLLGVFAVVFGALCLYGGAVWLLAHSIKLTLKGFQHFRRNRKIVLILIT